MTYGDAYAHRRKIRHVTQTWKMPPWNPVPGFGDFLEPRRLSETEIALIERWVTSGAPEGDPSDLPPPREFPGTWTRGAPDLVLDTMVDFPVPAREHDTYRCFTIPNRFAEDRWLSAVEFIPGNRRIVHHILTYVDAPGDSAALDDAEPGPGYTCFGGPGFIPRGGLGGWAPGAGPHAMPEGVGILLPAGARVDVTAIYDNSAANKHNRSTPPRPVGWGGGHHGRDVRRLPASDRGRRTPGRPPPLTRVM
jgi:hypothetical protein